MTSHPGQPTVEVTLPTRPAPTAPPPPVTQPVTEPLDHVRRHPRTCYWDVAECRWRCRDA